MQKLKPRIESAIQLDAKRKLGYAEFGPPHGLPILWFHGTPGARTQIPFKAREYANENDIRIICVERPGIGDSTPHLYVCIKDIVYDIEKLLMHLKIQQFGLVGLSGGGPYVLACSEYFKERVYGAAILGGVAPTIGDEAPLGGPAQRAIKIERFLCFAHKPISRILKSTIQSTSAYALPILDFGVKFIKNTETLTLSRPEMKEMILDDIISGTKSNFSSLIFDIILFARPWGFSVKDITTPTHFWAGTEDILVPAEHATELAGMMQRGTVTLCEGEGDLHGFDYGVDAVEFIMQFVGENCCS